MPSMSMAELLIAMVQAFGAPRPTSLGLSELYEALVNAIAGFVANPGVGALRVVKVVCNTNTEVPTSPPSGARTIDGYTVTTGDRVFLLNQTTVNDQGLWVANTGGNWTRPADWAMGAGIAEGTVIIVGGEGAHNAGQILVQTGAVVVGSGTTNYVVQAFNTLFSYSLSDAGPNGYTNGTIPTLNVAALTFGAALGSNPVTVFKNAGTPNGAVTAVHVGDLTVDTSTPALWQALATGTGNWSMIGPGVQILSTTFTANAYTLALTDDNTAQQASNGATPASITVPTNASVAFPIGTVVTVTQTASGKVSITAAGGVAIISSVSGGFVSGTTGCRAQSSTIGLLKTATNAWTLSGDAA